MSSQVLDGIDHDSLAVYAVWEPILRGDNERVARQATKLLDDPRVVHFWTSTRDVGVMFQAPIHLEDETAWDVYLVYPKGAVWNEQPPVPSYFMHQLGGRLPPGRRLDASVLADKLRAALER